MISKTEFDSLKPGDKVKIVDAWLPKEFEDDDCGPCKENEDGEMDHWLGKIMTVRERNAYNSDYIRMMEDICEGITLSGWFWNYLCIDRIADRTVIGLEELI